jgi:predicted ATPase/DNA-binding XRE family transcriptional regulator
MPMNKKSAEELSFGEWLRQRRHILDLTQQELADQVGCARITLRRIEAGALKPSKELALILLEKLGAPESEREAWLRFARGLSAPPEKSTESFTSQPTTNLPVSLTSFIGREKEQQEIASLLNKYRLVTLIGPGGVGKTRLSLEVGQKMLKNYLNGVWLVELAPVLDPLLVPRTIAIAIGLRDEPQRPIIDMLSGYLREKQMLIILDNCEHVLDPCAQLVDTLLKNCPNLKILATSRESLGIMGEVTYPVPSLGLPNMEQLLEKIRDYESVRLFEERAQLAQLGFLVTTENASSVAQICNQLDGIPLAIELVAARVRMFSTEQIAARLEQSLNLLTSGNRTSLPRHQTLQAAIEWSYDLLSPAEQTLFRRLSVFVNGWTLEAAEFVCSDENIKAEDILELLTQLINKSLVNTEDLQNEPRYRMLETIRQYANEKLIASGESNMLTDQHLDYFLSLAETAEPHLRRKEQIEWLKRLDAEHENMRAALKWAMSKPTTEPVLRLAGALESYWDIRTHWSEGSHWLDQALQKEWSEANISHKAARAKALYCRADLAYQMDDLTTLRTCAESALILCQEVKDFWGVAFSRTMIAEYWAQMGDSKVSKTLFEQSLMEFQKLGDARGQAFVLHLLARVLSIVGTREEYLECRQRAIIHARASGDRQSLGHSLLEGHVLNLTFEGKWDQAEKILQEVEQLFTEFGYPSGTNWNWTRAYRAYISFARGKLEEAKAGVELCIEYCHRVGEKASQAIYLIFLGLIAEIENNLQSAIKYQQKSLDLMKDIGSPRQIAWSLMILGRLRYQEGNREVALQHMQDSLYILRKGEVSKAKTAYIFCHLGGFFVEKKPDVAIQILGLNEILSQKLPHSRDPILDKPYFDRFLSAARAKLSEAEFTAAWEIGMKMTVDEAIKLALKTMEELLSESKTI